MPGDFGDSTSSEINAGERHKEASLSYSKSEEEGEEEEEEEEENRYDSDDMFEEWDDFSVYEGHEDDVASLSYSESDEEVNSYDSDADDSVLIGEVVFEELDGLNGPTTTLMGVTNGNNAMNEPEEMDSSPPLLFAESTKVLLDEKVMIEDDGGSTTTANHEGGECGNKATPSTAPLLGSIWVKNPKHGCMVRRSSRLMRLSMLG